MSTLDVVGLFKLGEINLINFTIINKKFYNYKFM